MEHKTVGDTYATQQMTTQCKTFCQRNLKVKVQVHTIEFPVILLAYIMHEEDGIER